MKITRRAACIAATAWLAGPALGQNYPSKPIRMVVPFAPGGASDFVARIVAPRLAEELGQSVVIENRGGVAGNIGMEYAASAPPDGYTCFLGNVGTLAINHAIYGPRQKVTAADFQPVSLVVNVPDVLVVNPGLPVKTVSELVDHIRKTPAISYASPGSGSLNRLAMELVRSELKLEMTHIPYKGGSGPAITDVVGGHVPMMFTTLPSALQLIKAGKLKALAVGGNARVSSLPDVPTLTEAGVPVVMSGSWQAVMFPAKTPAPVVARMHAAVLKTMAREDVKAALLQGGGVEVLTSATPKEAGDFIAEEARRWGAVAKAANATPD